jgi:hypothetical protein
MQVDVYAYTSTDVYACTSADVWVLARVIDASQCIPMHKYNVYAYTSMAEFIITMPSYACVYVWYTQIHAHTARWLGWWCFLFTHACFDTHWCACVPLLQCFLFTHVRLDTVCALAVMLCLSASEWVHVYAYASTDACSNMVGASQCIRMHKVWLCER